MSRILRAGALVVFLAAHSSAQIKQDTSKMPGVSGQVPATRVTIPEEMLVDTLFRLIGIWEAPPIPLMQESRRRYPEEYPATIKKRIQELTLANDTEISFIREMALSCNAETKALETRNPGRFAALRQLQAQGEEGTQEARRQGEQLALDRQHILKECIRRLHWRMGDQRYERLRFILDGSIGPQLRPNVAVQFINAPTEGSHSMRLWVCGQPSNWITFTTPICPDNGNLIDESSVSYGPGSMSGKATTKFKGKLAGYGPNPDFTGRIVEEDVISGGYGSNTCWALTGLGDNPIDPGPSGSWAIGTDQEYTIAPGTVSDGFDYIGVGNGTIGQYMLALCDGQDCEFFRDTQKMRIFACGGSGSPVEYDEHEIWMYFKRVSATTVTMVVGRDNASGTPGIAP